MTSQSSIGEELVENFQFLLEFRPSDECASVVNERMLTLPDKRTFRNVMGFILDILEPDWRSVISGLFIEPRDEKRFNIMLCDNFKVLRKGFPEAGIPLMTPSSMICFHGVRCRETLLKITAAIMLFIMKKEKYQPDEDVSRDVIIEYNDICEECNNLSKKIQQKREDDEKAASHQMDVLQLVVMAGYWNEEMKKRLLDLSDKTIITEMLKEKENSLNELKSLKEEIQPYLKHIHHKYNKTDCLCRPEFNLSDEKIWKISDLLSEADMNRMCIDIKFLKLILAVKTLKINAARNIKPNIEHDEHDLSTFIEKLEKLVSGDVYINTSVELNELLASSPLNLNMDSPATDTSRGFTPIITRDCMKIKKTSVKMDLKSLAEFIVPAKVRVSPVRPITSHTIVNTQFEKPNPNETIMSIVQRMRSGVKETPNKIGKQRFNSFDLKTSFPSHATTPGLFSHCVSSAKFEKLTPASKAEIPILSHTTGRRQSMGFVKPANCLVRRKLSCTPVPKVQQAIFPEKPKSTTEKDDVDKIFDKLVQQLVEDKDNESFCSDTTIGDLDSSLSGVECIKSPCAGNEHQLLPNEDHKLYLSATQTEQNSPLLEHSILSEVIEDDEEISALIESICDDEKECSTTQKLDDKEQLDIFLSDHEMSKVFAPQKKLQNSEITKKSGRQSLDLLIERFNAIKKAQQKK